MGWGLILLIVITSFEISLSQSQYNPGARQVSLSNSDVAVSNDVFSLFNNPAGLAQIGWRELGIYYSPAPYGFRELANGYFAYNEPFSFGSVAAGGMTYGFDLYREIKFLLGYSFSFENFFFGAAVNYHKVTIKNYGEDQSYYVDLGGLVHLTDNFNLGFFFHNINRASFGKEDDQIPAVINTGLSCSISPDLIFSLALEKDIRYNPSLLAGLNYDIIEFLSLRTGFSNEPARYSAGAGINFLNFSLDYAVFTHQLLGLTHQAGIILSFGKPEGQ